MNEDISRRVEELERLVQILRPDIPRFGPQDAEQESFRVTETLREEFTQPTSMGTEYLRQDSLSSLPSSGLRNGAMAWVSDGRKSGEAADSGTGVLAYFDEDAGAWKRLADDSDVAT